MNVYRTALWKLRLLEAFRNMFLQFEAYIGIEHAEIGECMRRYIGLNDAAAPILLNAQERMEQDKRLPFHKAMQDALDYYAAKNRGLLEKKDADLIAHTCRELGGMQRSHISEVLGRAGGLLERRITECREKDVKNGKLMNQLGIIIGIAIVILIL